MEAYRKRIYSEKKMLDNSILKLSAFLISGGFKEINFKQRTLLRGQRIAMRSYSLILGWRLK